MSGTEKAESVPSQAHLSIRYNSSNRMRFVPDVLIMNLPQPTLFHCFLLHGHSAGNMRYILCGRWLQPVSLLFVSSKTEGDNRDIPRRGRRACSCEGGCRGPTQSGSSEWCWLLTVDLLADNRDSSIFLIFRNSSLLGEKLPRVFDRYPSQLEDCLIFWPLGLG